MAVFSHSKELFLSEDGSPVLFYMRPCDTKAKLKPVIEHGGGTISSKFHPNSIKLAEEGNHAGDDYILSTYILDCVDKNTLLPVEKYKVGYQVSDDEDLQPASYIIKVAGKEKKGRKEYLLSEDLNIIKYVVEYCRTNPMGGNVIWKDMEKLEITSHTWQSMKHRYRHHILPNIQQYNIPKHQISLLTSNIKMAVVTPNKRGSILNYTQKMPLNTEKESNEGIAETAPNTFKDMADKGETADEDMTDKEEITDEDMTDEGPKTRKDTDKGQKNKQDNGSDEFDSGLLSIAQGISDKDKEGQLKTSPRSDSNSHLEKSKRARKQRWTAEALADEVSLSGDEIEAGYHSNSDDDDPRSRLIQKKKKRFSSEEEIVNMKKPSPRAKMASLVINPTQTEDDQSNCEIVSETDDEMYETDVNKAVQVIQVLMRKYDLDMEETVGILYSNSGNVQDTVHYLEKGVNQQGHPPWSDDDDAALKAGDAKMLERLRKKYGKAAVDTRLIYLED